MGVVLETKWAVNACQRKQKVMCCFIIYVFHGRSCLTQWTKLLLQNQCHFFIQYHVMTEPKILPALMITDVLEYAPHSYVFLLWLLQTPSAILLCTFSTKTQCWEQRSVGGWYSAFNAVIVLFCSRCFSSIPYSAKHWWWKTLANLANWSLIRQTFPCQCFTNP